MSSNAPYALITGGSSGIGLALAKLLVSKGKGVLLVALGNTGLPERTAELKASGADAHYLEIDLTEPTASEQIKAWVGENNFAVDLLANNAGMGYSGPFEELSTGFLSKMLQLNNQAVVSLTLTMMDELQKHPKAWIMNMASQAGLQPTPFKSAYSASKAFLVNFSQGLRTELSNSTISVTVICPSGVYTNEAVRERIRAAGKMGQRSAMEPEAVAEEALQALYQGKGMHIPGRFNRWLNRVGKVLPFGMKQRMMRKAFLKTLEEMQKK